MKTFYKWILLIATGTLALAAQAQDSINVPREDGAQVPVVVYEPGSSKGCPPLALISPGAGGSQNDISYLGKALADDGWLAIVMGHLESGRTALRSHMMAEGMKKGVLDLTIDRKAYEGRFMDIPATLKWADARCHAPFKALIGHSMGAATVMIEAGARDEVGAQGDDRFNAYVALSPQGPGSLFPENAWSGIHKPLMVLTGTKDSGTEGTWQWRTVPYAEMPAGCKWLGVIDGASHLNFAGMGFAGSTEKAATRLTLTFLDALRSGHCASVPQIDGVTMSAK